MFKVAGHYVRPKTKMSDPHSYANVSPLTVGYETTLTPNIPDSMHVSPLTFKYMTSGVQSLERQESSFEVEGGGL